MALFRSYNHIGNGLWIPCVVANHAVLLYPQQRFWSQMPCIFYFEFHCYSKLDVRFRLRMSGSVLNRPDTVKIPFNIPCMKFLKATDVCYTFTYRRPIDVQLQAVMHKSPKIGVRIQMAYEIWDTYIVVVHFAFSSWATVPYLWILFRKI